MLSSATPSPARQPALAPRRRHPVDMLRAVAARAGQARIPNASSSSSFSSSSTLPSSSMPHVLSCRRRHQRRRRRPSIAPSAVPAAYLEDDDEDVSLNVDDLDALTDDELADLLAGRNPSGYSEEELLRKVRGRQEAKRASIAAQYGDSLLKVELAERIDPFDCWLWFEAGGGNGGGGGGGSASSSSSKSKSSKGSSSWTPEDAELLDGVLTAWFMLGRLGAFNSANLQLSQGRGIAAKEYDATQLASAASSVFHDFSPRTDLDDDGGGKNASVSDEDGALEIQGRWARAWVNCGTADELALDVLLNALQTLAAEEVPALTKVMVGGELPWWPVPKVKKGAAMASGGGGGGGGSEEEDRELEGLLKGDF